MLGSSFMQGLKWGGRPHGTTLHSTFAIPCDTVPYRSWDEGSSGTMCVPNEAASQTITAAVRPSVTLQHQNTTWHVGGSCSFSLWWRNGRRSREQGKLGSVADQGGLCIVCTNVGPPLCLATCFCATLFGSFLVGWLTAHFNTELVPRKGDVALFFSSQGIEAFS